MLIDIDAMCVLHVLFHPFPPGYGYLVKVGSGCMRPCVCALCIRSLLVRRVSLLGFMLR